MCAEQSVADPLIAGLTAPRFTTTSFSTTESKKICGPDGSRITLLISAESVVLNGQVVQIRAGSNASAPIVAHLTAGNPYIVIDVGKFGVLTHYEFWATAVNGNNSVSVTEILRVR